MSTETKKSNLATKVKGLLGVAPICWTVGIIEIITFTPMLGTAGTYLSFVTGNVTALKVYEVKKEFAEHSKPIGTLLTDGKSFLKVAVKNGYISLTNVQLSGKKRMPVADLLNGFSTCGLNMNL